MKPTYEELEAQVKQLAAERDRLKANERVDNETIAILAGKKNALAAENAALKHGIGAAYDEMEQLDEGYHSTDDDGEPMDTLIKMVNAQAAIQDLAVNIATPATDAYLSQLRNEQWALGVDKFAEAMLSARGNDDTADVMEVISRLAKDFAVMIRDGKVE